MTLRGSDTSVWGWPSGIIVDLVFLVCLVDLVYLVCLDWQHYLSAPVKYTSLWRTSISRGKMEVIPSSNVILWMEVIPSEWKGPLRVGSEPKGWNKVMKTPWARSHPGSGVRLRPHRSVKWGLKWGQVCLWLMLISLFNFMDRTTGLPFVIQ